MPPSAVLQLVVLALVSAGMVSGMLISHIFRAASWTKKTGTQYLLIAFFSALMFIAGTTSHRYVYFSALYLMFTTLIVGIRLPVKGKTDDTKQK